MGAKESKQPDMFDVAMDMRMAARSFKKEAAGAERKEQQEKKRVADVSESKNQPRRSVRGRRTSPRSTPKMPFETTAIWSPCIDLPLRWRQLKA